LGFSLAVLVGGFCLTASPSWSQAASYQGRLTDGSGAARTGSVTLELKIYNALTEGDSLYEELHTSVPLTDAGVFSVLLGGGTEPVGSYDASLFPGLDDPRYLEVWVNGELLEPRQPIGTVPTALVAEEWAGGGSCPAGQSLRVLSGAGLVICEPHTLDTNTQLSEAQVDAAVANNNFSTGVHTTDTNTQLSETQVDAFVANNNFSTGVHTTDTNTQLSEAQVDAFVANNNFSTGVHTTDTNTQLSEAQVDAFVANNGFGLATDVSANTTGNATQSAEIAGLEALLTALEARLAGLETRFQSCSDGLTVADNATGLLWERKTGAFDGSLPASGICATAPGGCPDRHDVNNRYAWSNTGTAADGNAYTDFLDPLNADGFGGHSDWRLPAISELQSILIGLDVEFSSPDVDPADPAMGTNPTGQATLCAAAPCVDPGFAAVGGPTASSFYWSASSSASNSMAAWDAEALSGFVFVSPKTFDSFVRAVRAGSCGS
jgi:hypothetical protein